MTEQQAKQRLPALMTILWADFPDFMAAVFPPVAAIPVIIQVFAGENPNPGSGEGLSNEGIPIPYLLGFEAILILLCIPLLVFRVRRVRGLLRTGHETPGAITSARLSRNGSRLEYEFEYASKKYDKSLFIPFLIENIEAGDEVTVVVDPARPRRAIIKDLYY